MGRVCEERMHKEDKNMRAIPMFISIKTKQDKQDRIFGYFSPTQSLHNRTKDDQTL